MRTLVLALDAADPGRLADWTAAGDLPTLAGLMERGAQVPLRGNAGDLPDGEWWTLATGTDEGTHTNYSGWVVKPGTTALVFAPRASRRKPFWQIVLEQTDAHVLTLDLHKTAPLADPRMRSVQGWGQRAWTHRDSWPPELLGRLARRHRPAPRWLDDEMRRSARGEERYFRTLERVIRRRTAMYRELMAEQPWNLVVAGFSEIHSGGHVFERYADPGSPWFDEARAARHGDKLKALYRLADDALGELIAAAGDEVDVLVVTGKGTRPNTSGLRILPAVLEGLGYTIPAAGGNGGVTQKILGRVRASLPWSVRRHVNRRLPLETQTRIMSDLWSGPVDWSRTRAVSEPLFGTGLVRLNVRGREPGGIVDPADHAAVCDELEQDLRALTLPGGEPAVADVVRTPALLPGPHAGELPDLIVRYTRDHVVDAVHHPRLGLVTERLDDFAKSEHSNEGLLVAAGPRIAAAGRLGERPLPEVAPTVLALAGAPIPDDMPADVPDGLLAGVTPQRGDVAWVDDPWA